MNWFMAVLKKYAVFSGRARRKEYWMFVLFYILIYVALMIVEGLVGSPGILALVFALGILVPSIAVAARRLHDTDRSGWWLLIGFVPLVGGIVLLVFMCLDGTSGPNRFGADPKAEPEPA
ncbi:MAG: DUF805 domain-containing protein [Piscinibacter sp.]|uniref:DUF805 domain-containing protein n=1 Tax=Piscinibacter TaxID=1114981 RepID=UPI000FDEC902|nr:MULTISPECIES: DUF805 domain-containing protein [Piscinibacter]MCW5662220.1 DUF805 domain-containing protein [Piscinibacter sp.]